MKSDVACSHPRYADLHPKMIMRLLHLSEMRAALLLLLSNLPLNRILAFATRSSQL